jgi:hypothetical protein
MTTSTIITPETRSSPKGKLRGKSARMVQIGTISVHENSRKARVCELWQSSV